jgi:hypothetical protein
LKLLRDKSIDRLAERLNILYPDPDNDKDNDGYEGITHWKGKWIIPTEDWKKLGIPSIYKGVRNPLILHLDGLQFFPDGLVEFVLLYEGKSVNPYAEDIYPYHDDDPRPGSLEYKMSLDAPGHELTDAELKLWRTRIEERLAKAKKEDPFEIWIQDYKELLAFKKIKLPVYDDTHIV